MKTYLSEYNYNYETYEFGYKYYSNPELSELELAYKSGFLPYSADLNIDENIFYMARSIRIDADGFLLNSENRRINRKFETQNVYINKIKKSDFDLENKEFVKFCTTYISAKIWSDKMSDDRLTYILSRLYFNYIYQFIDWDQNILWYVLVCEWENFLHYWFSFYNLDIYTDLPLGKYMMQSMITYCKDNNISYIYLWTCYGSSWLYKVRDFDGVERRDGSIRNTDSKKLIEFCK